MLRLFINKSKKLHYTLINVQIVINFKNKKKVYSTNFTTSFF